MTDEAPISVKKSLEKLTLGKTKYEEHFRGELLY